MTYTCNCGETKTEPIPQKQIHNWQGGTENADTTITYVCNDCGTEKTEGTPFVPEAEATEPEESEVTELEAQPTQPTFPEKSDDSETIFAADETTESTLQKPESGNNSAEADSVHWIVFSALAACVLGGAVGWWLIRRR